MKQIEEAKLITAIKTPYLPSGEFDLNSFDSLVERQIENGTQGLIIGGTTGEGHLMNWDEHIMLIAHTVNRYSKDILIIGNTGSNNTREAVKATEQGFAVGMDCSLSINPYYGKTSEDGLLEHFSRVLALGPTIIYNVPPRTSQDIPTHIIEKLAENQNLIGVKECMGSERISHYEKQGIACWSGNDDQCHDSKHHYGSHGVISVASNLIPKTIGRLMTQTDEGLNDSLKPFFSWLFCVPNPIPLNTMMAMTGMIKPIFRLPYVPLSLDLRKKGKEILENLDLEEQFKDIRVLEDKDFLLI
jgi:4-hydroxy-tetrahydrodipicolinate synthase